MGSSIVKAVETIAAAMVKEKNLELIDVEFVKEGSVKILRIYIYKKGGVSIDDCVSVHKYLDKKIEEKLDIQEPYTMEVSSPGYDRAFKKEADFRRYMGEDIEIKLYKPFEGSKVHSGKLIDYKDEKITIETKDGKAVFIESDTAKINRIFKIN